MYQCRVTRLAPRVALRKESVDRNIRQMLLTRFFPGSLSARRAWIEIPIVPVELTTLVVALRKESVDRNKRLGLLGWLRTVALRKESVDRNLWDLMGGLSCDGRSPQGERG